jgi:hypothetical protein
VKRKTIDVAVLIEECNRLCRESTCSPEHRLGVCSFLEWVMMRQNVYVGFGYLSQSEVPKGELPGIIRDESPEHNHQFPDESRRFYYVHSFLGGNPPAKDAPGVNPKHYTAAGRA